LFIGALGVDDVNLLALFQWHSEAREASVRIDYGRFGGFLIERRVRSGNPNGDWYCDLDALRPATGRTVLVSQLAYWTFHRF
jgi:hypothetical protein